jgi:hypothetical protein
MNASGDVEIFPAGSNSTMVNFPGIQWFVWFRFSVSVRVVIKIGLEFVSKFVGFEQK